MKIKNCVLALVMIFTGMSAVAASESENDKEVKSIASAMLFENKVGVGNSIKNLIKQTNLSDAEITQRFDALDISQKYDVLEIVRTANLKKYASIDQSSEALRGQYALEDALEKFENQGLFVGDLSTDEIKSAISESGSELATNDQEIISFNSAPVPNLFSSCPLKSFTTPIYHSYKSISDPYVSTYYYSNVVTEVGEWPCDTELWYNDSKNRVYGMTYGIRQLIINSGTGYSGVLSKRTANGKDRLVIGIKAALYGYNDYALSQYVVIW